MSGIYGPVSSPADRADTLTVANQAARLALTATDVQPGDLVLQTDTDPATVWVLAGSDPSQAGNWVQTLRTAAAPSTGSVPAWDYLGRLENTGFAWNAFGVAGAAGIYANRFYFRDSSSVYNGITAVLDYTGLAVGGEFVAEAPFHGRSSTGPQLICEYADGVDFQVEADENGFAKFRSSSGTFTFGNGINYSTIEVYGDYTRFYAEAEGRLDGFGGSGYASKVRWTDSGLGFNGASPVAQSDPIADATDGPSAIARLNDLLAYLRLRGDIET